MRDEKPYVHTDEHGVLRVGATRVMLDAVIAAFQQGHSPETIRQQYPALSLEEVYGSIAYFLAHLDEVRIPCRRYEACTVYLPGTRFSWGTVASSATSEVNLSPGISRNTAESRAGEKRSLKCPSERTRPPGPITFSSKNCSGVMVYSISKGAAEQFSSSTSPRFGIRP